MEEKGEKIYKSLFTVSDTLSDAVCRGYKENRLSIGRTAILIQQEQQIFSLISCC
jgi:hypothetical protein